MCETITETLTLYAGIILGSVFVALLVMLGLVGIAILFNVLKDIIINGVDS